MNAPRLLPRTVQLCTHCQHNPAGFWVSRPGATVVRRPWCLAYCAGLDRGHHHVIPFDAAHPTGVVRRADRDSAVRRTSGPQGRPWVLRLRAALTGRILTVPGARGTRPAGRPGRLPEQLPHRRLA